MKTFYRLLFYLSLVSISRAESGDAGSEAQRARISLGEVTSIVLANNPAIKEAERRWSAAKERITQAAAWDDVKVSGDSRVRRVVETDHSRLLEGRRDLESSLSDAQSELNTLMNRDAFAPLGAPVDAPMSPMNLSVSRLRALTLAQRPEIQMARTKIDSEKSKVQLARRAWIPDPALSVKGQRYNEASQAVSELDAGISFTVPWINPRKYSAGVREAGENLKAAEHGLDREQNEALRLLRDQLEKIETAHHHVDLFRDKLVPQARQAFEANRLSYESGKASFLDWITAQRNLRDLEAIARAHLTDYQVAVAELESIIGAELYTRPNERAKTERNSR